MSTLSVFRGKGRAARWLRLALGLPLALAILLAVAWIGLRVGALDRFPWPQSWAFEGDHDAFVQCFEARADIAAKRNATFVTLFSERPPGDQPILVKMGGDLGRDGLRSLALEPREPGFVLHDRHYQPDHSPLSQPMSKADWLIAWRCGGS